ncbi:hypothetical protein HK101_008909 [Irineochytrium annulatum]|nr:hypothetical protein HK101_008909 [Irineochytrium annulatum]
MAILDQKTSLACSVLEDISITSLRKKMPHLANKTFIAAMIHAMEPVCVNMLEKGFPLTVNGPVVSQPLVAAAGKGATSGTAGNATDGKVGDAQAQAGGGAGAAPQTFDFPTHFMAAVCLGLDNVVRAMIKRADVNQSWHGVSPLHIAASKNAAQIVQLLLDNGADASQALLLSQYQLLRRLKSTYPKSTRPPKPIGFPLGLQAGPEGTATSGVARARKVRPSEEYAMEKRILPIELAAACGNWEIVRLLLPKTDQKTLSSCSFALLVQRDVEISVIFLKAGAPVSQADHTGATALHLASRAGKLDLVIALVHCGLDVNARGQGEWTPLHEAVSQRRLDIARYLIKSGADVYAKSSSGQTARDVATSMGMSEDELIDYFSMDAMPAVTTTDRELAVINQVKAIASGVKPELLKLSSAISIASSGSSSPNASAPISPGGRHSKTRKGTDRFPGLPSFLSRHSSGFGRGVGGGNGNAAAAAANGEDGGERKDSRDADTDANSVSSVDTPDSSSAPMAGRGVGGGGGAGGGGEDSVVGGDVPQHEGKASGVERKPSLFKTLFK